MPFVFDRNIQPFFILYFFINNCNQPVIFITNKIIGNHPWPIFIRKKFFQFDTQYNWPYFRSFCPDLYLFSRGKRRSQSPTTSDNAEADALFLKYALADCCDLLISLSFISIYKIMEQYHYQENTFDISEVGY